MNKLFLTMALAACTMIASAQYSVLTTVSETTDSTWSVTEKLGVGYQVNETDSGSANQDEDFTAYGISYAVNDDMSIGYSYHELEFDSGASLSDQESTGISASYTMGGMTLGGAINETDNMRGVDANDFESYEFNLSFAF